MKLYRVEDPAEFRDLLDTVPHLTITETVPLFPIVDPLPVSAKPRSTTITSFPSAMAGPARCDAAFLHLDARASRC